ncbi:helix-turn-helix domain-containing protein [Sphingomonas canadensis]|uniref:Helix-turn-helix domain-containing protein n=1 Tax=Sphingomonas canadensis TaxID=1219257 RepID=A0ABW3HB77_9SPHN|nr:AraC family transcriptional regulator [Sphingomonas canadensis]MCW3838368.1 AraC family transcriptional regulator [Sphingomonas canadensis]
MSAGPPQLEFVLEADGLLPHVHSYYLYRNEAAEIRGVERVDIGQLRFLMRGGGVRFLGDGRADTAFPVSLTGPGQAAAPYRLDGPCHCFGVALRPLGWKSLVGLPADKVAGRVLDAADVFGPEAAVLLERLRMMTTIEEMVAAVRPFLLARRRRIPPGHVALARAVREWVASGERIDALYRMVPMGPRQATRLCNEIFGGPPKLLERKYRAIRAAIRICNGDNPADVAEPFSDQPHMIKEIKHFTGHTPTTLRDGIDPVVAATLENETFHFLPEVIPESVDPGGD